MTKNEIRLRSNSSILGQRKKNQRKLRNKKRAHDRRMSESENSETDEREKFKANLKNAEEQDNSDAVRPILKREKCDETQQTANIEIEQSRNNNTNKRKCGGGKQQCNSVLSSDEQAATENHLECKNDLLFQLEI